MISPLCLLSLEKPSQSPSLFSGLKNLFSKETAPSRDGPQIPLRHSIKLLLDPMPPDIKIEVIRGILFKEDPSFAHDFLSNFPSETLSKEELFSLLTEALDRPELLKELLTRMLPDDSDKGILLQLLLHAAKNNQGEALKVLIPEYLSLDECLSAISRSTDSEELSLLLKAYQLFFDPEFFQGTVLFSLLAQSSSFGHLDHLKVFISFIDNNFDSLFFSLPQFVDLGNLDAIEVFLTFLPTNLKALFRANLLPLLRDSELIQLIQKTSSEEEITSALLSNHLENLSFDLLAAFLINFSSESRVNFVAEAFSKFDLRFFAGPSGRFFSNLFNLLSLEECRMVLSRFLFSQETIHFLLHPLLYFQNVKLARAFLLTLTPFNRTKILDKPYQFHANETPLTMTIRFGNADLLRALMEGLSRAQLKRVVNERTIHGGLTSLDLWALNPHEGIQTLLQSMGAVFTGTAQKPFTKAQYIAIHRNRLRPIHGSFFPMFPYFTLPRLFSSASQRNPLYAKALAAFSKAAENTLVSLDSLADRILAGETVVIPTGWINHQTSLIFSGSLVIKCNRGDGSFWHNSSILVYDMRIKPRKGPLIEILKMIRENRLQYPFFGWTLFYKNINLALGLTPRALTESEFFFLKQKPQKSPNCVNASAKSALRALIYLANLDEKNRATREALAQGKALYKKVTKADRAQARALLALQRS